MKDLLSKEHYCYKIHTFLIKNSAYPPFYRQPSYIEYPTPIFQGNLDSLLLWFLKNLNSPINKVGSVHYEDWCCKKSCKPTSTQKSSTNSWNWKLLKWTLSYHTMLHSCGKNCVIGNPPQLNSCEYGWERNEGEKSLRPTTL